MAKALVAQLESPFEPKTYKDEHRERVLELLRQKAKGMPLELAPEAGGSLAEVLERSLSRAKNGKASAPAPKAKRRLIKSDPAEAGGAAAPSRPAPCAAR